MRIPLILGILAIAILSILYLVSPTGAQISGGAAGKITGTIVLRDSPNNYGISTVSLSLPKAGCTVKITVCDYGGNPPTKLVIGADPVSNRDIKAGENYTGVTCGVRGYCPYGQSGCGVCYDISGSDCNSNDCCRPSYPYRCPVGYECAYNPSSACTFQFCSSTFAGLRPISSPGICCDLDGPDNIPGTADDNVISNGHCCPKSHPIYDPTSGNCIKNATVETSQVGRCSVLTTTLETAFTDITFTDSQGKPIDTADYVLVSYTC